MDKDKLTRDLESYKEIELAIKLPNGFVCEIGKRKGDFGPGVMLIVKSGEEVVAERFFLATYGTEKVAKYVGLIEELNPSDWRCWVELAHAKEQRAVKYDNIRSEWQKKEWDKHMKVADKLYKKATAMFNEKYGYADGEGWNIYPEHNMGPCTTTAYPLAVKGNDHFRFGKYTQYYMVPKPRTTSDNDADVKEMLEMQLKLESYWNGASPLCEGKIE